jgi:serine/threonine protein kinase
MGTQPPTEPFQNLGNFTIIEKLGEGNLGPVYRAIDQERGRAAILRILYDGIKWNPRIEAAFNRECDAIMALRHPNIASIYEIGKEHQPPYIAMESLGSRNLAALIARKEHIPVEVKLAIVIQIAEGLAYAHGKGVPHLDLWPAKIHITSEGIVKIRDFAITHVLMKYLPKPAVRWGTPIYLSPEQIQNEEVDERSDIFSLGTVLYEFFTGLHPFHHPNGNKTLDNIVLEASFPTFEQFPELPPGIWTILKTCLARNREERYQSMADLSAAFGELAASLDEDNRMVLAELFSSLGPLRKAAARPDAPGEIGGLLKEIQQLAQGENESGYTRLKRLMTELLEQQEFIRTACEETPELITANFFSDFAAGSLNTKSGQKTRTERVVTEVHKVEVAPSTGHDAEAAISTGHTEEAASAIPLENDSFGETPSTAAKESGETVSDPPLIPSPVPTASDAAACGDADSTDDADDTDDTDDADDDAADNADNADNDDNDDNDYAKDDYARKFPDSMPASRHGLIPNLSWRTTTAVLLVVLVLLAAAYFVLGGENPFHYWVGP